MGTRLRVELEGERRARRAIAKVDRALALAARRALSRTATKARMLGAQQISQELNLKRLYIRSKLEISKRPTLRDLEAVIEAKQSPIMLSRYGMRQLMRAAPGAKGSPIRGIPPGRKAAGVSVKVKRRGPRRTMRGAFIAPLGVRKLDDGTTERILGVAIRTGRTRRSFRVLYGPSVDQAWKSVRRDVLEKVKPVFRKHFRREAKFRLKALYG